MTSRNLINLVLLLLFFGLLAVAIYEPGKQEKPIAKAVTSIVLAAVKNLRIESPGRAVIILEKQGEQWRMQQPFAMPANNGRIQQVLKLTQAKSVASYPLAQVDMQQLQLHEPVLILNVDGQSLRFGTTTALGENRYLQVGDTVHLITDRYSHLARSAASEFVNHALLPAGSKVTQLQSAGVTVSLEDEAAQSLLQEWRHARAQKVSALQKTDAKTERVELSVENTEPLHFDVLHTDTEIIFLRLDVGLQYHFALEEGQRLLALPIAVPVDTKSSNTKPFTTN